MAGAKSGRVSDELLTYISEPLFLIPVNSFMDEHCLSMTYSLSQSITFSLIVEL